MVAARRLGAMVMVFSQKGEGYPAQHLAQKSLGTIFVRKILFEQCQEEM